MRPAWKRKAILVLCLALLGSSIAGLVLFGFGSSSESLIVQDVSHSSSAVPVLCDLDARPTWYKNTTSVGLDFALLAVEFGTTVILSDGLTQSIATGSLLLVIGTVSMERKEHERPQKLRDRVLDIISNSPGIHLRELHRSIGCAMGALQYHLNNLEHDGIVVSMRNGNARHLYLSGFSDDEQVLRLTSLSRNPTVQLVLRECIANGRITQAELSRTLSLDKSLISYYVSSLIKNDVLRVVRVFGRERPVILSDWARVSLASFGLLVQ
ncbi:MAG: winged helix-turn-helix transcriptional regulator [Candidatus Thorarchaeota archaeon]|nr:MAG: winged helix-turn-helix transcriptional regulator [Candidatus Thorarchaeota archaeon]